MRKIIEFLFAILGLLLFAGAARSQTTESLVPIGFVNAVGLPTKTELTIDNQSVKPAGFAEGGYASSFGVPAGSHQFAVSNGNCEKLVSTVEVKEKTSPLYVLYKVSSRQPDGTTKHTLKLATIGPQSPPKQPTFFVFSTLEGRVVTVNLNRVAVSIQPLKVIPFNGGSLSLEGEGIKPLRMSPREAGTYVLVFFDGSDSHLHRAIVEMAQ